MEITNYKSIVTASGSTIIHLQFMNDNFKISMDANWMGKKMYIILDGFVKINTPIMKTLYTKTLKNQITNEIINLYIPENHDSELAFRFFDIGKNVLFDCHDNVGGCVIAGNGIFNTCYAINGKKCIVNCDKCFTYDTILIGCIGNSFDEYSMESQYGQFDELLSYNLLRKVESDQN